MKTSISFFSVFILFFQLYSTAQNLIPDPGFEIIEKVPSHKYNGIQCTKYWVNAVPTPGDYYNSLAKSKLLGVSVPRNIFGYQKAHSGNGYAGICVQKDLKEYVETKLTSQLVKGQKYLIEFYISRAENRLGYVNEFGVLFSTKIRTDGETTGLAIKPDVVFANQDGYKDTKNWTKLSATYTAEGFETVLILGHFNYDKTISYKRKAHYYIDDVSITKVYEETSPAVENGEIAVTKQEEKDSNKEVFTPAIGEIVTLNNIFFNSNKSEILPASYEELNKLSDYLFANTNTFIQINGHTDNTGSEEENKKLSEARAKAVSTYLVTKGIDEKRINYIGYGSVKPIASNDTEEGKQKNRRVEFVITVK